MGLQYGIYTFNSAPILCSGTGQSHNKEANHGFFQHNRSSRPGTGSIRSQNTDWVCTHNGFLFLDPVARFIPHLTTGSGTECVHSTWPVERMVTSIKWLQFLEFFNSGTPWTGRQLLTDTGLKDKATTDLAKQQFLHRINLLSLLQDSSLIFQQSRGLRAARHLTGDCATFEPFTLQRSMLPSSVLWV